MFVLSSTSHHVVGRQPSQVQVIPIADRRGHCIRLTRDWVRLE